MPDGYLLNPGLIPDVGLGESASHNILT
jgi:hypothetical protein